MAGSVTSILDLIASSQSQKEVTANALFEAASPAMMYARRAKTSAGLTWGYYGGSLLINGAIVTVQNGTLLLTANRGNWIEADPANGQVILNNTGWTSGLIPLYLILTNDDSIIGYEDLRSAYSAASAAIGDSLAAHVAAADPHPQYLTQTEADARYLQSVGAQPFDLTAFYPGMIPASALVTRVPFARAVSFPAGLAGSVAKSAAAATAQTDFNVTKNGVSVGTIRFAAGASSATFIAASAFAMAAGDWLSIVAPASADSTLADVGFVLVGSR